MPTPLPTGVVTILFADAEKSTSAWQEDESSTRASLREVFSIAQACASEFEGAYVKNTGDGFLLVFEQPANAVCAACEIQRRLVGAAWPSELVPIRMRIGVHTGSVALSESSDYSGFEMNRAQRIMDAAHGTQVLISEACSLHIEKDRLDGLHLRPLGPCRLKDLLSPINLFRAEIEGLAQSAEAPRVLGRGLHNFPIEDRPFLGRKGEVLALSSMLRQGTKRLITLTGMGGIGKTRLAKQVAAEVADDFTGGAWLVELDLLKDRSEMLPALCSVLGLELAGESPETALRAELADRRVLLVLDCFEHLAIHADLVRWILQSGPGVACLATSRVALKLVEEAEFPVAPLGIPSDRGRSKNESAELFIEAARHFRHDLALNSRDRDTVDAICTGLEGIPLALILHAARAKYFSLDRILEQTRTSRLEGGAIRTEADKHETLRRVVDDSFALLSEADRSLLRRLSVFVGGFTYEDAEAVTGDGGSAFPMGLVNLCDHSLVIATRAARLDRYKILDTVREYIAATTQSAGFAEEMRSARRKHARRFAAVVMSVDQRMRAGAWSEATERFRADLGNFREAIAQSVLDDDDESLLAFANHLARFYFEAGLWDDFEGLATAAEGALARGGDTASRLELLGLRGALARRKGMEDDGRRYWSERLSIAEGAGDMESAADTLFDLADQALERGVLRDARQFVKKGLEFAKGPKRDHLLARLHTLDARICVAEGRSEAAKRAAIKSLRFLREDAPKDIALYVRRLLGEVYRDLGENDLAEEQIRLGLRVSLEGDRVITAGWALLDLATILERKGDLATVGVALIAASRIHSGGESRFTAASRDRLSQFRQRHAEAFGALIGLSAEPWSELVQGILRSETPQADMREAAPAYAVASGRPVLEGDWSGKRES